MVACSLEIFGECKKGSSPLKQDNTFFQQNGLFQKKSTPPRRMACWKFSREGGLRALAFKDEQALSNVTRSNLLLLK